jgi:hypothetical protein
LDEFIFNIIAKVDTTIIDVEQRITQVHLTEEKKEESCRKVSNNFLLKE